LFLNLKIGKYDVDEVLSRRKKYCHILFANKKVTIEKLHTDKTTQHLKTNKMDQNWKNERK